MKAAGVIGSAMRERTLGKTELKVSELALGTWGLSGDGYGPIAPGEALRVIERAKAMGITLFETADCYSRGSLETDLGSALKGSEATVVTRWGTDMKGNPERKRFDAAYLKECAEKSRERLGEVRLIGLLHNPSAQTLKDGEATDTMKGLVEAGVICHWGVSIGDTEVGEAALEAEAPILSLPYNILTVQPLRSLATKIEETGVGLLAHSVLFYGLLTGRWAPGKEFRHLDHRAQRWPEGALRQRIQHLDAVRPLVSGDVTTMRSAAVRFVLENSAVASAILGPKNGTQLDQLVRECQGEPPYLSEGKMSALEGRLRNLELPR